MQRRIFASVSLVPPAALAIALVLALSSDRVAAATVKLTATIDGAQAASTCPQGSAGTGSATMTYDTDTNLLSWEITFGGLSGPPTMAHFHGPAPPGMDAGIQVGIADLTSPSEGSATITETQEQDLLDGLWYINYHTSKCSAGEIRGQVLEVVVGGIAELPDPVEAPSVAPDSGGNGSLLAGLIAGVTAGALAMTGAAWYARNRWLRR